MNSISVLGYAELDCRSDFSFLRAASHPEELVERAQALGYRALALTDCLALWLPGKQLDADTGRWLGERFPGRAWIGVELHRSGGDRERLTRLRACGLPLMAAGGVLMNDSERRPRRGEPPPSGVFGPAQQPCFQPLGADGFGTVQQLDRADSYRRYHIRTNSESIHPSCGVMRVYLVETMDPYRCEEQR